MSADESIWSVIIRCDDDNRNWFRLPREVYVFMDAIIVKVEMDYFPVDFNSLNVLIYVLIGHERGLNF